MSCFVASKNNVILFAQGGWDSEEMLTTNEKKFGVQSTYSSDLKGYT